MTDSAKTHLQKVGKDAGGLRLTIRGGKGCGGNEYDLTPLGESEIDPTDDFVKINDTTFLYIPAIEALRLFGTKIDFIEDDLGNRRLEISNPNETGRCGCGKSVTF